jgi:triphosphoribosyl-dephospho-CoA synthase
MGHLIFISRSAQAAEVLTHPEQLARLAWQALVAEAELTPKPGLVDRRGSGSHTDLSLDRMRSSARTIAPYFAEMAFAAEVAPMDQALRATVAAIGREAEAAMLRTTAGSNAHRGAIWVLGLLACAASQSADLHAENIARNAGYLARLPDRAPAADRISRRGSTQPLRSKRSSRRSLCGLPSRDRSRTPGFEGGAEDGPIGAG